MLFTVLIISHYILCLSHFASKVHSAAAIPANISLFHIGRERERWTHQRHIRCCHSSTNLAFIFSVCMTHWVTAALSDTLSATSHRCSEKKVLTLKNRLAASTVREPEDDRPKFLPCQTFIWTSEGQMGAVDWAVIGVRSLPYTAQRGCNLVQLLNESFGSRIMIEILLNRKEHAKL